MEILNLGPLRGNEGNEEDWGGVVTLVALVVVRQAKPIQTSQALPPISFFFVFFVPSWFEFPNLQPAFSSRPERSALPAEW